MRTGRALRAVRSIRLERGGASPMDLAYALYAGALTVLIVGIPVLRAVVLELAEPDAAAALLTHGPSAATAVAGLAAAALVLAGGARGPALLSPFLTAALAGGDLPRAAVLARPFARAVLASAALAGLVALLPGLGLLVAGRAEPWPVVAWTAGGALLGVVLACCWLAGQRLTEAGRGIGAAVLLGSALIAVLRPTPVVPWSAVGTLFPGAAADASAGAPSPGDAAVALAVLAASAVAALAVAPASSAASAGRTCGRRRSGGRRRRRSPRPATSPWRRAGSGPCRGSAAAGGRSAADPRRPSSCGATSWAPCARRCARSPRASGSRPRAPSSRWRSTARGRGS
ncbi:hypothetical protein [Clavibacter zhangzhiyongii]|uniref:hypothetical protein n=1 Tax=Clavibacter zhangzhiyongii TaxID=2768071 RepID=UPI0039DF9A26